MVELLRVDDRLLHGQVAYAWCKNLTVNLIVIANDEVTKDQAAKNAFAAFETCWCQFGYFDS